jgi:1-deoxy-D-xylulose-5-phosphate reductoisomerase
LKRSMILLGSTGSIGTQALVVAQTHGIQIIALTARRNVARMEEQVRRFRPQLAVMSEPAAAADLRQRVADCPVRVLSGEEGVLEAAQGNSGVVLNALVGIAGLKPTLCALKAGNTLALANKETLVAGGELVMRAAKEAGVPILPVDSEHSAVFQCLQALPPNRALKKIILTASGGPFFGKTRAELAGVTAAQALRHPNWSMGAKVTIDSATMMNKGLEIMEAAWLFGLPESQIDVVVHRESVIHSMVEFDDGAVLAQLGVPDMKLPIQYALTYPERFPCPSESLNLTEYGKLTFFEPDSDTFRCMELCREAIRRGGLVPAAANGANETAVELFLQGKISFLQIPELVERAMLRQEKASADSVDAVLEADRRAASFVREQAGQ